MSLAVVVAVLVIVSLMGLAMLPLLTESGGEVSGIEDADLVRQELEAERTRLLAALKDVDLDLAMGKVAPDDHASMKRGLEDRALEVLAELERLPPPPAA